MNTPVPHDIPLPLPAAEAFLKTLLVLAFVVHILFVNLMVGGAILSLYYEIKGRKNALYDELSYFIAETITVNKSLAVVFGVAPLLLINTIYTVWFYAANVLTGSIWIMVVPSVTVAFLLTYLHKYSWPSLKNHKAIHISIMAAAVVVFLFIPLIFLTNINLMLFPDRWSQVKGFTSALMLPNVFPRYFHFLAACLAATSLFLVWTLKSGRWIKAGSSLEKNKLQLMREFYSVALIVSCLQFLIGPLVLFTLPTQGMNLKMLVAIFTGVVFAAHAIRYMWHELKSSAEEIGKNVIKISVLIGLTVLFMASGRHFYREQALSVSKEAVRKKTEEYQALVRAAQETPTLSESEIVGDPNDKAKKLIMSCSACHGLENRVVGPPIREIQKIYAGNPQGIVTWAKAPGKKRPDYPQMPAMPLPEEDLKIIADYMLKL